MQGYRTAVAWVLLIILASVALALQLEPDYFTPEVAGGDFARYEKIFVQLWPNETIAPWRYRILYPLLARIPHALGASPTASFFWVTLAAAFASCLVFRRYLVLLGFGEQAALIGLLVFAATAGGTAPLRHYAYPDTLVNLLTLLALVYMLQGRILAIAVVLTIGVLVKDSILMIVPLVFFWVPHSRRIRNIIILLAPPGMVLVLLRFIFYTDVSYSYFSAQNLEIITGYWRTEMVKGPVRWVLAALAFSLGTLWMMALLGLKNNRAFFVKTLPYTLLLLLPLALTIDTDRALCLFAPFVIPLAMAPLQAARPERSLLPYWGGLLVGLTFVSQAIYYQDSAIKFTMFPVLALACFGIAWWLSRNRAFSISTHMKP